jgi:hypothetical protein
MARVRNDGTIKSTALKKHAMAHTVHLVHCADRREQTRQRGRCSREHWGASQLRTFSFARGVARPAIAVDRAATGSDDGAEAKRRGTAGSLERAYARSAAQFAAATTRSRRGIANMI